MSEAASAWHYDGETAVRHRVDAWVEEDALVLETGARVPLAQLVGRGTADGSAIYGRRDLAGWRIGFDGAIPPGLAARLPREERYGRWVDRLGLGLAAVAFALLAAVAIGIAWQAPQWLAPLVPASWERRFGDALVGDFGGRFCSTPAGDAALATLTARLAPGERLDVRVANIGMVNAVALPGGKIVLFDELLAKADGPDEVAGVLGHEIGHVRARDVMAALLRQLGLSVVLGGASDAGGYLNALLATTFTREAEARADTHAILALQRARISPAATAGFFRRLSRGEPGEGRVATAIGYLSSHPLSRARERAFRGAVAADATYTPALTAAEWTALRGMCRADPNMVKDRSFGPFE